MCANTSRTARDSAHTRQFRGESSVTSVKRRVSNRQLARPKRWMKPFGTSFVQYVEVLPRRNRECFPQPTDAPNPHQ